MSWNPKYYILYENKHLDNLVWPEKWGNRCRANVCTMLQEELNVGTIGSEIKMIWNSWHERQIIKDYNITYQELHDYLRANTNMFSFQAKGTRKRAMKELTNRGVNNLVCVNDYRKVLLYQAYYHNHKKFPAELSTKE